ncbi:hypothetical protein BpHYR1_013698 [Brachionus plicatilis]|uniref:Uncharacterized protein n=1 Tax=Brachionus plicatilis TaxID=10195 RepID=A0A3M7R585_BRAPC|nr:hypothetical protein BpHYR1_013698 [Brachionus plicatilis]
MFGKHDEITKIKNLRLMACIYKIYTKKVYDVKKIVQNERLNQVPFKNATSCEGIKFLNEIIKRVFKSSQVLS